MSKQNQHRRLKMIATQKIENREKKVLFKIKKIYYENAYETINHSKLNIINVRSTTKNFFIAICDKQNMNLQ